MASKIPSLLTTFIKLAVTPAPSEFGTTPLNKRIEVATKKTLNNLQNSNPPMTQVKVMSFDEFTKSCKLKSLEQYKKDIKPHFPQFSEATLERLHNEHCHAMYRNYLRLTKNPSDDPGRAI